ncbi:MAG: L-threonylcarbamoyladenylate synthase [Actinomycetota bacterium]
MADIVSAGSPDALSRAAAALAAGELVVIPTDTVYGLAARLDRPEALDRLFELKHRPRSKPVAVLVADLAVARTLGSFNSDALRRAGQWPGALTLVVPALEPLPQLGGDGLAIGLRVPAHAWTLELLRQSGPLAATSANPSGLPTGVAVAQVVRELPEGVALFVDGGRLEAAPSEVVSLIGTPQVLRER